MSVSRRNFIGGSAAFGLLSAALADTELVHALGDAKPPSSEPTFGQNYWSSLYAGDSGAARGPARHMSPEERIPAIYFSNPADQAPVVRHSYEIKDTELPDFTDEAVVTMELTAFRPSSADHEALSQVNFANMHLSCQRVSGSAFVGPLAWATIATVFSSKAKSLPAVNALDWNALSGQDSATPAAAAKSANSNPRIQHLLLSHGAGKLSVNVTTTPKKSALDKILAVCINTSKIVTPLFGFPAISTLALGAFYDFYGKVEAARMDNFLLSTAQQDVVVAKQGLKVADLSVRALHLLSGDYILVPQIHQTAFESKLPALTVINGMVVEKSSTGALADRVKNAIPDVSYLALSVRVQPASEVPNMVGITDPILGDNATPASGSGTGQKKSGQSKKTP